MRILVLSDLYPPVAYGGYERECAAVVAHLRESHEVLVLTSDRDAAGLPRDPGVHRALPYLGGGRVRGVLRAPWAAARAARVTRGVLRAFDPELVFAWENLAVPQAALAVAAAHPAPLLLRFCVPFITRLYDGDRFLRELRGGSGSPGPWSAAMRVLNRLPALSLDVTTPRRAAISWVSDALRERSAVSDAVVPVLERTIWPATGQADRFARLPRDPASEPTIAYVGRVVPEKGVDIAVRALARLDATHGIRARLVIAGPVEPGLRAELDRLAASLGVADRLEWRGQLEEDALGVLLSRAHALVIPSRWWEPLALVCLEGAFARVPVVAAHVGGIPEALRPGVHALLFGVDDDEACAAALAETLTDHRGTAARVQAAFARAQASFSFDAYLAATDRFLTDALAALAGEPVPGGRPPPVLSPVA